MEQKHHAYPLPSICMAQNKVDGMEHGLILSEWSVFPLIKKAL
jgi:hypothetical protein